MKIIGITGASGAGKSTLVELLNLPVVDADKAARKATEKGSECLNLLCKNFGEAVLNADGTLNRKALAEKAFATKKKTELLNSISHPFIKKIMADEIECHRQNGEKAIVLDAPQLFEAGCESLCDIVIGVLADKDLRKSRIMARDSIDDKASQTRLGAEKSDEFFKDRCDKIIINNGEFDKLKQEADNLLKELDI